MSRFDVIVDASVLERKLTRLEKQVLPEATRKTINALAFDAQQTTRAYMGLTFDRPTPYMLRGVMVKPATPQVRVAEVYMRDEATKGTPPTKVLRATSQGVQRRQKRSEVALYRAGLLARDEGMVPTKHMRLDRYGNVPAGKVIQMLSQVKAFSEVGFKANVTRRSAARNKARAKYFSPDPRTRNRLKPGIYERYGKGGRQIRPVMLFVKLPSYRKQFDMPAVVEKDVRRRMGPYFKRILAGEVRRLGR